MSYDVVSGSVNKDVAKPTIKYTALLNVTPDNMHMVGIIHYDMKGQTRVLSLREVCLPEDTAPLWQLMYDFLRSSANAPLTIAPPSIVALVNCLQRGQAAGNELLAKLRFAYVATLPQDKNGNANVVRYTDVQSILTLWNNVELASATLTFNLQ